ncbi:MAG: hypothetical protein SGBAC_009675, partial [Bacillariaceae sp.]
ISAFEGNVDDLASLKAAMKGCTGIHINLSGGSTEAHGTQQVIQAANSLRDEETTIRRISLISGVTTCEENTWYEGTKAKLQAENYLIESGYNYTIFRCTMFMETLPKLKVLVGPQPTPWHFLAASDYARMVSKSFTTPGASNEILFLYGLKPPCTLPEAMSWYYIPICDPSRPPVPTMSIENALSAVNGTTVNTFNLTEKGIAKFVWLGKIRELGDPSKANDLLGAPKTTLAQWCKDYACAK